LALQLATSLSAITLFGRMAPAIESIIEDNVVSLEAVEGMLEAVYAPSEFPNARRSFDEAYARARGNVTEKEETPVLERIGQLAPGAFGGDEVAVQRLAAELRDLGSINRKAMRDADEAAKNLGIAGAWVMVVLGAAGFVAGLSMLRRLRRRLLFPLREISSVLRAAAAGDRLRRCTARGAPPGDLAEIMYHINALLERRVEEECTSTLRDSVMMPPIDGPERPPE
jgi:hypothetical protein